MAEHSVHMGGESVAGVAGVDDQCPAQGAAQGQGGTEPCGSATDDDAVEEFSFSGAGQARKILGW
ncbi:hypothetical protein GCM10011359_27860 [Nesterenkonia alkaliphila]|nr:hypothetical protein GCM10011359_27860 [Nesterenkonia alkaliphila]